MLMQKDLSQRRERGGEKRLKAREVWKIGSQKRGEERWPCGFVHHSLRGDERVVARVEKRGIERVRMGGSRE